MGYPSLVKNVAFDRETQFLIKWAGMELRVKKRARITAFRRIRDRAKHQLPSDTRLAVCLPDRDAFELYLPFVQWAHPRRTYFDIIQPREVVAAMFV